MSSVVRSVLLFSFLGSLEFLSAQSISCVTTAVPPVVRIEGLTERIGDILITCNSLPNTMVTANFTFVMDTNVTNRISAGNTLTGIEFTIDSGSGPQPVLAQPNLVDTHTLTFNGVPITFSPQGAAALRIADIRVNASGVQLGGAIVASIGINAAGLALTGNQLVVARPQRGLYAGYASRLVCVQSGSLLPASIDFTGLIQARTAFASARVSEGFADALLPHSADANLNADSGHRIIVRYSGFTSDSRLFVPDVVAGSDAVQPTAGGDFGLPASGGAYAPSANGTLLLARVPGANANGAGGTPVYQPGPIGSGTVVFNAVSEIPVVNGSAYAVYEVVDSNKAAVETAQFPTFLGLPPDGNRSPSETNESVFLAPQSTTINASPVEPLPRFAAVAPPPDCAIVGDCATYLPSLAVDRTSLQLTAAAGTGIQQDYFVIRNTGGGALQWTVTVSYGSGSGWLSVNQSKGTNNTTVLVYANPAKLAPGTYTATLTVDAQSAGSQTVNVSLTVTAPAPALPAISRVLNAASFAVAPAVPGSLTTVMGSNFTGKIISATFDGVPAQILFSNAGQINLLVPASVGGKSTAQLVVTVDGLTSTPTAVNVAPFSPAIFAGAVLNEDWTPNDISHGAKAGSIIQIFATGLSGAGTIMGHIHDRDIALPYYAGPAPGLDGVQQIDLTVPADLPAMTTAVYVCAIGAGAGARVCSLPAQLTIQ
jgi:uncharacterized protein (TIGR03437 family)